MPTKPGWWWWRNGNASGKHSTWTVANVWLAPIISKETQPHALYATVCGWKYNMPVNEMGGEWGEEIPPSDGIRALIKSKAESLGLSEAHGQEAPWNIVYISNRPLTDKEKAYGLTITPSRKEQ